jgi:hypothetical protein
MNSFFHQFLDILKVAFHLHFEVLLHVAIVDLVRHLAGNPVDEDWHSAMSSVLLILAWSSANSAVAVPCFEIKLFDAFR